MPTPCHAWGAPYLYLVATDTATKGALMTLAIAALALSSWAFLLGAAIRHASAQEVSS